MTEPQRSLHPPAYAAPAATPIPVLSAVAFAALMLMILIGLQPLSPKGFSTTLNGDGDAVRQIIYVGIMALAIAATPIARPGRLLVLPATLAVALLWCWLSLSWAIAPAIAFRRVALTTMIVWTVFKTVTDIGYASAVKISRGVLALTVVLNFVAIAILPSAIHQASEIGEGNLVGAWRGIAAHKNMAGAVCAVTILFYTFDARRLRPGVRAAVGLAAAGFLYKTESKTSLGVLFIALVAGWLYRRYSPRFRALLIPLLIAATAVAIAAYQMWGAEIAKRMEDPDAFTGRGAIWVVLLRYVGDHPFFGAGFGSFWNIGPYSPVFDYTHTWVSLQASGHNGYLDITTQIGLPGLILVIVAIAVAPLGRLLTSVSVPREEGALAVALLVFCLGQNMTETTLLERDVIVELFLMLALALTRLVTLRPGRRTPSRPKHVAAQPRAAS